MALTPLATAMYRRVRSTDAPGILGAAGGMVAFFMGLASRLIAGIARSFVSEQHAITSAMAAGLPRDRYGVIF